MIKDHVYEHLQRIYKADQDKPFRKQFSQEKHHEYIDHVTVVEFIKKTLSQVGIVISNRAKGPR